MYQIIKNFKNRPLKTFVSFLILLVLFTFTSFSYSTKVTNDEISDYLFRNLGVNLIIYGDINDHYGYAINEKQYRDVYAIYQEILDGLSEIGGNSVKYETYLQTNKIYSASNLFDENNYKIFFFDYPYGDDEDFLKNISRDYTNNRQYITALESSNNPLNDDMLLYSYYSGYIPNIIGVNSPNFSDINLDYMSIKDGRSFNQTEIENGSHSAIISDYTYIIDRNGIKKAEVGDIIPISVQVNDTIKTFEFEIIGIFDAPLIGGIQVLNGIFLENIGIVNMQENVYTSSVYIPQITFDEISNYFEKSVKEQDFKLVKTLWQEFDLFQNYQASGNEYYYSQHGGIRPLVINIESFDSLNRISDFISTKIIELNDVSKRNIEYTFFSNLDRFATVISSVQANQKQFQILSFVSIIACIIFFVLYIRSDIESSKKQIGIAIALGMNKKEVITNKFLEYLLMMIGPMILSFMITYHSIHKYLFSLNNNLLNNVSSINIFNNYADVITVNFPIISIVIYLLLIISALIFACAVGYFKLSHLNIKAILIEGESV